MRVLVLASGGKDSSYATWWATLRGWDVAGLVTIRVTGDDSMMFQVPSTALAGMQAASADIPWLPISIDGDVDTEMRVLEGALLDFAGTILVISHDRWFLDRVATHILAFEGESHVEWFEGNFSDYETDRKKRLGDEGPKRIKYKPVIR